MSDMPNPPADPTAAYSAVREHELVLNEAAAAMERAVIPPLLTLNGGAAAAFLTLLGALGTESDLRANIWWAGGAVVAWLAGLVSAAFGFQAAKNQQKHVNTGYRLMREMLERKVFGPALADLIERQPEKGEEQPSEREKRDQRVKANDSAKKSGEQFQLWWQSSVFFFAAGGLLALLAILTG